ncbi:MAG: DNA-3-methyladenine glycosylase [Bacilli bacterium]|jgi:DNA-3-methyladenine glycosylase|nr:DNA-3-methyladenine glycosylase [Bacilli bacterium]
MSRLGIDFYRQDVLVVAPALIGKLLVRQFPDGKIMRYRITETEAYRGEEDMACHARVGKTKRTYPLYKRGGYAYVYLCYGIHYLFNVVTGLKDYPQAVLIRGVEGYHGPAKLTNMMHINQSLNMADLTTSNAIWLEDDGFKAQYTTANRVGIDYASEPYKSIKWRYIMKREATF